MTQDNFDPPPDFVLPDQPPLTPGNDELASEDDALVQKSHAHASAMIANLKLQLVAELVTVSTVFGPIWRADFNFPEATTGINRMMSWERDGKFFFLSAIGQHVPPL